MAYAPFSVVFGEQPSAAKWNILGTNDASFADGTGIGTNAIAAASLATNAITLGYASITGNLATASATPVQVTGLTSAVTIPAGNRKIRITAFITNAGASSAGNWSFTLWDGVVSSGTQIGQAFFAIGTTTSAVIAQAIVTPSAGAKTYNVGFQTSAGTLTLIAGSTFPAFILVEAI